jgi:hypothetical protein
LREHRVLRERSDPTKRFRSLVAVIAVLGVDPFAYLSFGAADEWATIERQIREAKTAADHQAIAAFSEKEAQAAPKLHNTHVAMEAA